MPCGSSTIRGQIPALGKRLKMGVGKVTLYNTL